MRDRHVYAMQERKREGERRERGREEGERGGGRGAPPSLTLMISLLLLSCTLPLDQG